MKFRHMVVRVKELYNGVKGNPEKDFLLRADKFLDIAGKTSTIRLDRGELSLDYTTLYHLEWVLGSLVVTVRFFQFGDSVMILALETDSSNEPYSAVKKTFDSVPSAAMAFMTWVNDYTNDTGELQLAYTYTPVTFLRP